MNQHFSDINFEYNKYNKGSNRSLKSCDKLYKANQDGKVYLEKCILNDKNFLIFQQKNLNKNNLFITTESLDLTDSVKTECDTPNEKSVLENYSEKKVKKNVEKKNNQSK